MSSKQSKHPRVSFKIEAGPGAKRVSAKAVARVFDALQDIFYNIGDDILNNKPRRGGDFPLKVKDQFALEVTGLKYGSVDVQFQLAAPDDTVDGSPTYAHKALERAGMLFGIVQKPEPGLDQERLAAVASDGIRRRRILKEVEKLVSPSDEYRIKGHWTGTDIRLTPAVLPQVRQLLRAEVVTADQVVTGRVIKISVAGRREFLLDPIEGKQITVRYPAAAEDAMRNVLGRLATVSVTRDGTSHTIESEEDVQGLRALPIDSFVVDDELIPLDPPLDFEFEVDEKDQYVSEHEGLGILAVAKDLPSLVKDIRAHLQAVWAIYVEADDDTLGPDALELRRKLLKIAGRA